MCPERTRTEVARLKRFELPTPRFVISVQLLGFDTQKSCCSQSKKIFLLVSFLADLTDRRLGAS